MRTIAFTRHEGGAWIPWEEGAGPGGTVHAIKFDNGDVWDTVNGWRKPPPLTLQQRINLLLAQERGWLKSAAAAPSLELKSWAISEADWAASKRKVLEGAAG